MMTAMPDANPDATADASPAAAPGTAPDRGPQEPTSLSPAPVEAWRELMAGNQRFVSGASRHPNQDADRRAETAAKQTPFATVFGCMDSRVAAEIIFDRGIGDLAVVRTAGHVVDSGVLGSVEFGVAQLGTPLVVVLGHDSCGAVTAAVQAHHTGQTPTGFVRDIIERVSPSVLSANRAANGRQNAGESAGPDVDTVVTEHVRHTVRLLIERSRVLAEAVDAGEVAVVGLFYQLVDGRTRLVEVAGDVGERSPSSAG